MTSPGVSETIQLGGHGWFGAIHAASSPDRTAAALEFSLMAGLASDYIYRGTTLSDRKPTVGAAIEAKLGRFYAGGTVASVKLPTDPDAEITLGGGVRPSVGTVDFDFGVTYFLYPGETPVGPTKGTDYWEATARGDTKIGEAIRVGGGYAYAPNFSNTGAWSQYAVFGAGYDVPSRSLPANLGVSFTAGAGYSWFGHQSAALGGFELPAYLDWQVGVTLTRKMLNLDLRYYDTNLSKEDCYVLTGDPNAQPGGRIDPISNPAGLTSRWCSATFVAKFRFALN